jgi:hypothetical protein
LRADEKTSDSEAPVERPAGEGGDAANAPRRWREWNDFVGGLVECAVAAPNVPRYAAVEKLRALAVAAGVAALPVRGNKGPDEDMKRRHDACFKLLTDCVPQQDLGSTRIHGNTTCLLHLALFFAHAPTYKRGVAAVPLRVAENDPHMVRALWRGVAWAAARR